MGIETNRISLITREIITETELVREDWEITEDRCRREYQGGLARMWQVLFQPLIHCSFNTIFVLGIALVTVKNVYINVDPALEDFMFK